MKNLLFITHDSSRTGAPILLLNLIKWLNANKKNEYNITLLTVNGGDLIPEFSSIVTTIQLNKNFSSSFYRLSKFRSNTHYKKTLNKVVKTNWDLIFSNTIVNGKILEILKTNNAPIVSYIHELKFSIDKYVKKGFALGTLQNSEYFICGSKLVQKTLVDSFDIDTSKTKVVYSFEDIKNKHKNKKIAEELKRELNIPNDSFIVAMAGSFCWRKGADLFAKTATLINSENINFLWIGADNMEEVNKVKYDLLKSETNANIKFIPSSPDYSKYFNLMDLFYLSSREDPYPMVMVEATSYGIPIICFENAGGTQEFIDTKTGHVIPYGDLDLVAEKIKYYSENRKVLIENERSIKEKSLKMHNIETNAFQIYNVMESIMKSNNK